MRDYLQEIFATFLILDKSKDELSDALNTLYVPPREARDFVLDVTAADNSTSQSALVQLELTWWCANGELDFCLYPVQRQENKYPGSASGMTVLDLPVKDSELQRLVYHKTDGSARLVPVQNLKYRPTRRSADAGSSWVLRPHRVPGSQRIIYRLLVSAGRYRLHFGNTFAWRTAKHVYFHVSQAQPSEACLGQFSAQLLSAKSSSFSPSPEQASSAPGGRAVGRRLLSCLAAVALGVVWWHAQSSPLLLLLCCCLLLAAAAAVACCRKKKKKKKSSKGLDVAPPPRQFALQPPPRSQLVKHEHVYAPETDATDAFVALVSALREALLTDADVIKCLEGDSSMKNWLSDATLSRYEEIHLIFAQISHFFILWL